MWGTTKFARLPLKCNFPCDYCLVCLWWYVDCLYVAVFDLCCCSRLIVIQFLLPLLSFPGFCWDRYKLCRLRETPPSSWTLLVPYRPAGAVLYFCMFSLAPSVDGICAGVGETLDIAVATMWIEYMPELKWKGHRCCAIGTAPVPGIKCFLASCVGEKRKEDGLTLSFPI